MGSWYFHCSTRNLLGQAERVRRDGYASEAAARQARDATILRKAHTLKKWLREHPGVDVASGNSSGAYAEAVLHAMPADLNVQFRDLSVRRHSQA